MSDRPVIVPSANGPYIIKGLQNLSDETGAVATEGTVALCRCGRSANKPFCDGTHTKIDFDSSNQGGSNPDQVDTYVGKGITIHDNRKTCSHAGVCTDNLATVFRMGIEPWIDPDGAKVDEIIEIIQRCPSGALSYSVAEDNYQGNPDLDGEIAIAPMGPYAVKGNCGLGGVEFDQGAIHEHYALCRCGASKNKPFCDGSHWTVWPDKETFDQN
jgi:CDGSH-type Zn-finger protein